MENENTNNITDNENTQPVQAEEKLFTQAEVNEIVRKRLAKEKAKAQPETKPAEAPAIDDAALTARSNRLDCKEYILNNGLSTDLLDVIDTSDVNVFIEKVSKLTELMPKQGSYPEVEDRGEVTHLPDPDSAIRSAFKNTAHKPKEFNY